MIKDKGRHYSVSRFAFQFPPRHLAEAERVAHTNYATRSAFMDAVEGIRMRIRLINTMQRLVEGSQWTSQFFVLSKEVRK